MVNSRITSMKFPIELPNHIPTETHSIENTRCVCVLSRALNPDRKPITASDRALTSRVTKIAASSPRPDALCR